MNREHGAGMRANMRREAGFTLIELIVSMGVILVIVEAITRLVRGLRSK